MRTWKPGRTTAGAGVAQPCQLAKSFRGHRFTGLADYQYVAAGEAFAAADGEESIGPYGAESEPLLVVPPTFSQHDQPVDYAFRNFRAGGDGKPGDGAGAAAGLLPSPGAWSQ